MNCPKCNQEMERRKHAPNETAYLSRPYYFSEWDYCPNCRHVQHHEKFKVINRPSTESISPNGSRQNQVVMKDDRKIYSRYIFNCGLQTLWKGDAAVPGSQFRSVAITSDAFNSTQASFQVLMLEGVGDGIKDGRFAGTKGGPNVLFDKDVQGLDVAGQKFEELVLDSERQGFKKISFMDIVEFEEKALA